MKKLTVLLAVLLMLAFVIHTAYAKEPETRNVILMTTYQQIGWGDRFELGALDSAGNLWTYESSSRGDIPYDDSGLLSWAESAEELTLQATLSDASMTDILSLVDAVPAKPVSYQSYACDAGTQISYAIRKDSSGAAEIIVLGASGDDTFENTDPGAQSLYKILRKLFPGVTAYDRIGNMSPAGFCKTNILPFCGYEGIDLTKLRLYAFANDCEEGSSETEPALSAAEIAGITVTGKQNSLSVTGNTITYCFLNGNGETVAAFEFYGNLLVMPDGMYSVDP